MVAGSGYPQAMSAPAPAALTPMKPRVATPASVPDSGATKKKDIWDDDDWGDFDKKD